MAHQAWMDGTDPPPPPNKDKPKDPPKNDESLGITDTETI